VKAAPEKDLATFFLTLEKIPDLKSLGTNLRETQYGMWRTLGVQPRDVAAMMGVTRHAKPGDPKYKVFLAYATGLRKIKAD
jgi:hypothetical protein